MLLGPHKAPAIHAAQHERAGRAKGFNTTGSTADLPDQKAASGGGHLMQSRSQGIINFMHFRVIAILHKQVAKPQSPPQESRKPLHVNVHHILVQDRRLSH